MTNYNLFITAAASLAKRLHADQKDKSGVDYFEGHLTAVASRGTTWLEKIAGYLHDASEYTLLSVDEVLNLLEQEAGAELPLNAKQELATVLNLLDHRNTQSRYAHIDTIGKNLLATSVKLNDLKHNLYLSRLPVPTTEEDIDRIKNYQREYNYLTRKQEDLRKLRVLFIHGYSGGEFGTTATELKQQLGNKSTVFAPAFSNEIEKFDNILANIAQAQTVIEHEKIDLVIGSSIGAFTALNLTGIPKILINPCMKPSEQFGKPHLVSTTDEEIAKHLELEEKLKPTEEEQEQTWAFFAEENELFSYKELFCTLFDEKKAFTTKGTHRNNPQRIKEDIIPLISLINGELIVSVSLPFLVKYIERKPDKTMQIYNLMDYDLFERAMDGMSSWVVIKRFTDYELMKKIMDRLAKENKAALELDREAFGYEYEYTVDTLMLSDENRIILKDGTFHQLISLLKRIVGKEEITKYGSDFIKFPSLLDEGVELFKIKPSSYDTCKYNDGYVLQLKTKNISNFIVLDKDANVVGTYMTHNYISSTADNFSYPSIKDDHLIFCTRINRYEKNEREPYESENEDEIICAVEKVSLTNLDDYLVKKINLTSSVVDLF